MTSQKAHKAELAVDAVKLKRRLQTLAEKKLAGMTVPEQIAYLREKFGQSNTTKQTRLSK